MVEIIGTEAVEKLIGTPKIDDLYGRGGNDIIEGLGSNDALFGGNGDDVLFGGDGEDILRGQIGGDLMNGGSDDDVLYALGNRRSTGQTIRDKIVELTNGLIPKSVDSPDILIGGEGKDLFYLQNNKSRGGLGFYRGQQYAVIKDFNSREDKINLPGKSGNYRGYLYGERNQSTAILYVEDIDADVGISRESDIEDPSLQVSEGTALIAIVENTTVRNMDSDDFYSYTPVSTDTSSGSNLIPSIIVVTLAICSIVALKRRNIR